jgi:hypothetical protein
MPKTSHSAEQALSQVAIEKLARKTKADILSELKEQGIVSLDDLAKAVVKSAQSAAKSGVAAFDDEIFGICYKFTTYRPRFSAEDIRTISDGFQKVLH